jgi:hypothetical protein
LTLRVHDPKFLHAGILVFVQLEEHILRARGWLKNIQYQVRNSVKTFRAKIISLADYKKIRLYHSLVIAVNLST